MIKGQVPVKGFTLYVLCFSVNCTIHTHCKRVSDVFKNEEARLKDHQPNHVLILLFKTMVISCIKLLTLPLQPHLNLASNPLKMITSFLMYLVNLPNLPWYSHD